jgi:hypothetical protein
LGGKSGSRTTTKGECDRLNRLGETSRALSAWSEQLRQAFNEGLLAARRLVTEKATNEQAYDNRLRREWEIACSTLIATMHAGGRLLTVRTDGDCG